LFGGTALSLNANSSEPLNENIFTALLAFINVAGRAPDSQSVFRKTPEVSMALYLGLVGLHKLGCGPAYVTMISKAVNLPVHNNGKSIVIGPVPNYLKE
jgi:hypothetical protein